LDIPELKIAKDGVSANIKINRDPPAVSRLLKSALLVCHRLNQHQIPTKGTLPFYFYFFWRRNERGFSKQTQKLKGKGVEYRATETDS
jgi:hypothetical protein